MSTTSLSPIPPELAAEIYQRHRAGEPVKELRDWLLEVHRISVSLRTVQRYCRRLRALREVRGDELEIVKNDQVRELVKPTLKGDLEQLAALRARLEGYELAAAKVGDTVTALRAAGEQTRALAVSIRAGAEDALEAKVAELERLLDEGEFDE